MIAPTRALVLLAMIPAAGSLALFVAPSFSSMLLAVDALLVLAFAWDAFFLPSSRSLVVARECGPVASQGERHEMVLVLENRSRRSFAAELRDDADPTFENSPVEFRVLVPGRARVRVRYILTPRRRGSFKLDFVFIRSTSRFGLWRKLHRVPAPFELRVYPALKQIARYAMYARVNRMTMLGVRQSRRIGSDNEFERLREYTPDDQFRAIDWRATARRRKLIVKDFQSNHSQRIVFLVDCGRMMVNESGGASLLDHSLDAVLTLAHVALARGDQVGLLAFSDRVLRWMEPAGGKKQVNRLVHAVHDLFPEFVESLYQEAFLHLHRHCRKRTLVVLVTNVIDDRNADQVRTHLTHIAGRHLPLGVFLRDREIFDPLAGLPPVGQIRRRIGTDLSATDVYRAAAAADILDWRAQLLADLEHKGALTLDVLPDQFTAPLINEYLRIKSRHLL